MRVTLGSAAAEQEASAIEALAHNPWPWPQSAIAASWSLDPRLTRLPCFGCLADYPVTNTESFKAQTHLSARTNSSVTLEDVNKPDILNFNSQFLC